MNVADWLGLWPTGMVIAGIVCRVYADSIHDRRSRIILESTAQMTIIAGAVGFALLFAPR